MASQPSSQPELITLLPTTPYLFIYSLPLLLFSLAFTFAGTFLTLDRTRTFPSRGTGTVYTSLPIPGGSSDTFTKKKLNLVLEGGIGGLIGGYLFGVHLSTALALLIPATTTSAPLTYQSFLAVWVLSIIPTTALGARYRYVSYAFFGASGGTLTSLAICVAIHPSLPPRIILTITFLVLFFLLSLVFATIPRLYNLTFHPFLRICTASTGAFGLTQSIALLLSPPELSWANVWERLWVNNGANWGTTREHGLSAAYWVFFLVGIAVDWALHKWIGECPDEKWDDYLAHYTANLPNLPDRAGTFQPFSSLWDKLFHPTPSSPFELASSKDPDGIYSPSDLDFKSHPGLPFAMSGVPIGKLSKKDRQWDNGEATLSGALMKKSGKKRRHGLGKFDPLSRRGRKPVKFDSDLSSESDSQDGEDEATKKAVCSAQQERTALADPPPQPTLFPARTFSSSAPTLVDRDKAIRPATDPLAALDYEKEIEAVKHNLRRNDADDGAVEYSDFEEDVASTKGSGKSLTVDRDGERWSPAFLARHQYRGVRQPPSGTHFAQILPGAMPVPATPSLIKAMDRIAIAQKDAFVIAGGPASNSAKPKSVSHPTEPEVGVATKRAPQWEEFWREVQVKAHS